MSDLNDGKKPDSELRVRLRELMAIPERDRSDEQWDELAALELQLAPGNRIDPPRRGEPNPGVSNNQARRPPKNHGQPQRPGGKKTRKPGR